jgi:hypothetical protein
LSLPMKIIMEIDMLKIKMTVETPLISKMLIYFKNLKTNQIHNDTILTILPNQFWIKGFGLFRFLYFS